MPPPVEPPESSALGDFWSAAAGFLTGLGVWLTSKVRKTRATKHENGGGLDQMISKIEIQHEKFFERARLDSDRQLRELREALMEEIKETRQILYEQRDEVLARLQAILTSQEVEVEVQRRMRDRLREEGD